MQWPHVIASRTFVIEGPWVTIWVRVLPQNCSPPKYCAPPLYWSHSFIWGLIVRAICLSHLAGWFLHPATLSRRDRDQQLKQARVWHACGDEGTKWGCALTKQFFAASSPCLVPAFNPSFLTVSQSDDRSLPIYCFERSQGHLMNKEIQVYAVTAKLKSTKGLLDPTSCDVGFSSISSVAHRVTQRKRSEF